MFISMKHVPNNQWLSIVWFKSLKNVSHNNFPETMHEINIFFFYSSGSQIPLIQSITKTAFNV